MAIDKPTSARCVNKVCSSNPSWDAEFATVFCIVCISDWDQTASDGVTSVTPSQRGRRDYREKIPDRI